MEMLTKSKVENIYIHIPFCKKKCNYCAFVSFTTLQKFEEQYISALEKEIASFSSDNPIKTIYIGGGTPNLLNINSIEKIFIALNKNFTFAPNIEITMEFNPKISNEQYIKEVKNFGVNRISLGVQSFNPHILKTLGRIHEVQDVFKTIEYLNNAQITNYNLDLIYGIFSQSLSDIENDLSIIKKINPPHVSTYGLKIEANTPFEEFDKTNLPDEDMCADMYLLISEFLEKNNYKHYEISNFAKENFQSRHNSAYWQNREYIGFGTAAHGYINKIRYKNPDSIEKYIKNPLDKEIVHKNTIADIFEETVFLGLRLKHGINLQEIKNRFNIDLYKEKKEIINNFIKTKHLVYENDRIFLTNTGFLLSNYIIGKLL